MSKKEKEYSFTFDVPVEKIKQVRVSRYRGIVEEFCNSGRDTALLNWKGSQQFATVAIGLRNVIKTRGYGCKIVTKNKKIYLVRTEEPEVVTGIPKALEKEAEQEQE